MVDYKAKAARAKARGDYDKPSAVARRKSSEYREKVSDRVKEYRAQGLRKSQVFHWLTTTEFKEAYDRFFKQQKGVCKICKKEPKENRRLDLDHCHETFRLRGLLCVGCNTKLGWFEKYEAEILDHLNPR